MTRERERRGGGRGGGAERIDERNEARDKRREREGWIERERESDGREIERETSG